MQGSNSPIFPILKIAGLHERLTAYAHFDLNPLSKTHWIYIDLKSTLEPTDPEHYDPWT